MASKLAGKRVKIFYNDTPSHVTATEGILDDITDDHYVLQDGNNIPRDKVIRVVELER